ncbi:tyrosine-protein phosphatase [Streptomyces sp. MMG1121]|uniref:tyrosine-protein phosphatase n=1 Tax=Streptomyces sp. MMG1121 TaxID=1415544 RepID=UPI0006AE46B8|nr:tyrosine-protein phosphatase [Streptomyces sp. MMG1121]KOV60446.1 protein tyrosine phosphatase [Streptomyces sp. MMG1121]
MHARRIRHTTAVVVCAVALSGPPALAAAATPAPSATAPARPTGAVTTATVRHIALQGAVNVRDLGGYRTVDGHAIRYGQVFRADALNNLTAADVTSLSGLGLRTVVDLRTPQEVRGDGADRLPDGLAAVSRPVDVLGLYETTAAVIGSKDPVKQQEALGDGRAEQLMRDIYRTFVTDAASRGQFAATIRDIAASGQAPLLYHCTSGKDRTGWLSYLVLRAVGVPSATAEQDYLLSNTFRADADRKAREGLKQAGYMQNPDLLVPLQEARTDYLDTALDQVGQDYGGFYGYLTKGLGLDIRTLAELRARLVR